MNRWAMPSVTGVDLPAEYEKYLSIPADMVDKIINPSPAEFAEFRPAWHERWVQWNRGRKLM